MEDIMSNDAEPSATTRITVLHLCEHFGGAEASLHGVSRAFQWWLPLFDKDRFRVLLCSRKGYDKAAEQMIQSGIEPLYLGYGKMDPRNLTALKRLCRKERVDILHAHGFGACLWTRLAGKMLGIPVIVHGRCNYHTVPLVMRPVEAILGPSTRYALAVSESTRRYMIEKRHIPAANVQVLYNGILLDRVERISDERRTELRRELGVGPKDKVVGIVGRVVSHKGHLDAFEAMCYLRHDVPTIQLWVVGDGDYLPVLEDWIGDHNVGDVVRLLGFRRDVMEVIQCFDAQLFPSHYEGTPNTLFEALAVGGCIVAAPIDGQGELLENGKTAQMFDLGDAHDMAHQVRPALLRPELNAKLRGNALAHSKNFDGRKCVAGMEALYERIMRETRGVGARTCS